jgi:hypothetical protein
LIKAAGLEMKVELLQKELAERNAVIYELQKKSAKKVSRKQALALAATRA